MRFRPWMIARLALVVGIGLVTCGYSSCVFVSNTGGSGDNGNGGVVGTFSTNLVLRDSSGVATNSFVFGEQIRFDLESRNSSSQMVTLTFPDAQIYDFVVLPENSSEVIWRWSDNMTFPDVVTRLTFDPHSSKAYSVLWTGILADGTQLPAGNYRARGALVFDELASDPLAASDKGSPLVSFTVR